MYNNKYPHICILCGYLCENIPFASIRSPAADGEPILSHLTNGHDECRGQTGVGEQRNVEVDGRAADLVSVVQLAARLVLRNVYDQIDLLVAYVVYHVG